MKPNFGRRAWTQAGPRLSCLVLTLASVLVAGTVLAQTAQPENRAVFSLNGLSGMPIWSPEGEELGQVEDILVDVQMRRLAYAIVSTGGFLGMGKREYIVPWNALQSDPQGTGLVVNVTELLPVPDPTVENVMDREYFGHLVHRHYGVAPYWEEELPTPRAGAEKQPSAVQPPPAPQAAPDQGEAAGRP